MTIDPAIIAQINDSVHDTHTDMYFTWLDPDHLWTADVDEPGGGILARTVFSFDTGIATGLNDFSLIEPVQEVWFGTTLGDHSYGRGRIRAIASGDAGVTGTLTIAANSLVVPDNAIITFILYYPLKPRPPFIDQAGVFYKDKNIPYSDQNKFAQPIVIAGGNRAQFLVGGQWILQSQLPSSYSYTPGATITNYTATVLPSAGSIVSLDTGTGIGTITFTTPGSRWVKYTVTDSNGKTQASWRWYYAHDPSPDPNNLHYPFKTFSVTSSRWSQNGWEAGISATDGVSLSELPDETIGILWYDNYFRGIRYNFSLAPDNNQSLLSGYTRKDTNPSDLSTGSQKADIQLTTIGQVDAHEYSYSMSLHQVPGDPAKWWEFSAWMTPTRASAAFMRWHSTLMEVADVLGVEDNTDPIAWAEFEDGTLYGMPNKFLQDRSIRHLLTTDMTGRIHIKPEIQLLTDSERDALPINHDIIKKDLSGDVTLLRTPEPQSPFAHVSGLSYPGTFSPVTGEPNAEPHCSIAPGTDPLDKGPSPASLTRQTLRSQDHANELSGRVLAERNNINREWRIKLAGFWAPLLDPAYGSFWRTDILLADTARQTVLTNLKLILTEVSLRTSIGTGVVLASASFEPEAEGLPGISVECPSFPDLGGFPPFFPDDDGAAKGDLLTASSVHRLSKANKTWTELTTQSTLDMFMDPAWDGVDPGQTPIWRCGPGYIKYSADSGDNWVTKTPSTNPPNPLEDSPAPTSTSVTYFQGAPGVEDQFGFVARWQNDTNAWRGWFVDTIDAGTTWVWTPITAAGGGLGTEVAATGGIGQSIGKPSRAIAQVSETECIVATNVAGNAGNITYYVQNDTTLDPTSVQFAVGGVANLSSVAMLDATRFVIVWSDFNFDIRARAGTIIAGAFLLGTEAIVKTNIALGSPNVTDVKIYPIDATTVACNVFDVSIAANSGMYTFGIKVTGTVITGAGAHLAQSAGFTIISADVCKINGSTTQIVTAHNNDNADAVVSRLNIAANGDVTSSATANIVGFTTVTAVTVCTDSTDVALFVSGDSDLKVAHVTTSVLSIDTFSTVNGANRSQTRVIAGQLTGNYIVCAVAETSSSQLRAYIMEWDSIGTTYTLTADVPILGVLFPGISVGANSITQFSQYFVAGGNSVWLLGSPGEVYPISVTIDIGGELMYGTYSIGGIIEFAVYDLLIDPRPLYDAHNLGPGTILEVIARDSVAFVRSSKGFTGSTWIHGRFKHPFDLGLDQYLMEYVADEFDFNEFDNNLGLNHFGAIIDDWTGLFLVENVSGGSQAKLYFAPNFDDFFLKGSFPFTGWVEYNGIAYDWLGDFLYAAGNALTDPPLVIQTTGPYTVFLNIQYDHPPTPGVKAVEVLI